MEGFICGRRLESAIDAEAMDEGAIEIIRFHWEEWWKKKPRASVP